MVSKIRVISLDPEVHRKLRELSFHEDRSMKTLVSEMIESKYEETKKGFSNGRKEPHRNKVSKN
jgi:predicted DNA-binding protein